jgi:type IV secretory pathway component VirB8
MYERDMNLIDAYDKINRLEKTALKLAVAVVCLASALAVAGILIIRRFVF